MEVVTDDQGIPTSRQEEEVNGNSRKGEPGVSGKEGDYIVEWIGAGIGCTSLAGHAALRQDPDSQEDLTIESGTIGTGGSCRHSRGSSIESVKEVQPGMGGRLPRSPRISTCGTTDYTH